MKHITSKIVSFICVICMLMSCGVIVNAADSDVTISVTLDSTNRNAQIKLDNVGTMIYSAQITLNMGNDSAKYTLTANNKNAYTTLQNDGNSVILYIDSTDLMDGSKEINLATLTSDRVMNIGGKAELILVDRSMNSAVYRDVTVRTGQASNNAQNPSGGDDSSSSGGGMGNAIIAGGAANIQTPAQNTQFGFADVANDFWAKDSINYVTAVGLFEGTSPTTFEPHINMTRAMYVAVLNRFGAKIDPTWYIPCDSPMKFDDIPDGEWYSDAVSWAGGIGLVNGIGENLFGPYDSITREQIAVMTVNFANLCSKEIPQTEEEIDFADMNSINDWALEAVKTAQRAGLIYGREDGNFAPQDTATRAEVAAILHRFAQTIK